MLPELGIEFVALELDPGNPGVPDPALIPVRMAEFRERGVRWMYLGSSTFLRIHGDLYTSSAVENGIAIVSPYESLVRDNRALLSIAARYYDIGKLAADQALAILRDGASPGDLPILQASDFAYVVNMDVARELNQDSALRILAGRRNRIELTNPRSGSHVRSGPGAVMGDGGTNGSKVRKPDLRPHRSKWPLSSLMSNAAICSKVRSWGGSRLPRAVLRDRAISTNQR